MTAAGRVSPAPALGLLDEDATGRRERIGQLRTVRGHLRTAALGGTEREIDVALATFVSAAWEAGFSRATTASSATAALEEGLRKRRRRPGGAAAVGPLALWTTRALRLYDARTGAIGIDVW